MAARKKTAAETQLAKYQSMRDFKTTQEPAGKVKKTKSKESIFIVQKHAATRLHYDFRLEHNGVLKSWAVTKGLSLDPAEKRLAVHVEDHPIEYATFEGTIPKGQYGGGTVMLWDRGHWEPLDSDIDRALEKGRLTFRLHGERLKGEWHLVRMRFGGNKYKDNGKENWLLIKSHDGFMNETDPFFITEKFTKSVATKRTFEQIAAGNEVWQSNRAEEKTPAKKVTERKTIVKEMQTMAKVEKSTDAVKGKKAKLPKFVQVELATLVDAPPKGDDWVHEFKFDGYRALVRIDKGKVQLITRSENDWTTKFLDLPDVFKKLELKDALIDGEVVVPDAKGHITFHALQNILGRFGNKKVEPGQHKGQLHYYAFDLLHYNGLDVTRLPLLERKEMLRGILPKNHKRLHYSEHFFESGADVLQNVCTLKMEGIVSKRIDTPYRSGRGKDWLKSKCGNEQEFIIIGFTYQSKNEGLLGALLIGYYANEVLKLAGKVGTGFTQDEAKSLLARLEKLRIDRPILKDIPYLYRRGTVWIEPKLVAQIVFGEWTPDGMLRHASYQGLREDKPAKQVKREEEQSLPGKKASKVEKLPAQTKQVLKPALKTKTKKNAVIINGITLSHPEKILYSNDGITKQELAEYYARIGKIMLPHVAGYPLSFMRCNEGVGGECFFQRHEDSDSGRLKSAPIKLKDTTRDYIYIDDAEALVEMAQLNVLEVHAWGTKARAPDTPDKIVFDFDPDEAVPFERVKDAAFEMRDRMTQLGMESFLKTTGGKGLHVVVPFKPGPDWDEVKGFSEAMAYLMSEDSPDLYLANMNKAKRKGKIYIDYQRNGKSASAIAPYSTRARATAPIAMPLEWNALKKLKAPNLVNIRNFPARFIDPWQDIAKIKQKLKLK